MSYYAEALTRAVCYECIETTARPCRLRLARFVVRLKDGRLPETALMGEMLEGGQRYVARQEYDKLERLNKGVLRGVRYRIQRGEANVSCRECKRMAFEQVEEGVAHFMRGWFQKNGDFNKLRGLKSRREKADREAAEAFYKGQWPKSGIPGGFRPFAVSATCGHLLLPESQTPSGRNFVGQWSSPPSLGRRPTG